MAEVLLLRNQKQSKHKMLTACRKECNCLSMHARLHAFHKYMHACMQTLRYIPTLRTYTYMPVQIRYGDLVVFMYERSLKSPPSQIRKPWIKHWTFYVRNWIACPCTIIDILHIHTCMQLHYMPTLRTYTYRSLRRHYRHFLVCMYVQSLKCPPSQISKQIVKHWILNVFREELNRIFYACSVAHITYIHACIASHTYIAYIHVQAT